MGSGPGQATLNCLCIAGPDSYHGVSRWKVLLSEQIEQRQRSYSRVLSGLLQSPIVYRGKRTASKAAYVMKRLLKSTGKAAWIAATTFLVLAVPLILAMDREQMQNELEMKQASLVGTPPATALKK